MNTDVPLSLISKPVSIGDLLRTTNPYPHGAYFKVADRVGEVVTLNECSPDGVLKEPVTFVPVVSDREMMDIKFGPVWMLVNRKPGDKP